MLRVVERVLLTGGAILAIYCGFAWLQIRQVANTPIPPPPAQTEAVRPPDETPDFDEAVAPVAPSVATGTWLARLEAPSAGMRATILEGTDEGTLSKAAGHIEGTALPGPTGNIGIAGHRDTVFRGVRKLKLGDELTLTTADRVYRYQIDRTEIVDPDEVWVLGPMPKPTLTLVTCYPFDAIGHAPRRFIVHGDLIGEEVRKAEAGK